MLDAMKYVEQVLSKENVAFIEGLKKKLKSSVHELVEQDEFELAIRQTEYLSVMDSLEVKLVVRQKGTLVNNTRPNHEEMDDITNEVASIMAKELAIKNSNLLESMKDGLKQLSMEKLASENFECAMELMNKIRNMNNLVVDIKIEPLVVAKEQEEIPEELYEFMNSLIGNKLVGSGLKIVNFGNCCR